MLGAVALVGVALALAGMGSRLFGSPKVASAVDEDDADDPHSPQGGHGSTLAVMSTALVSTVHSASRKPPVKAFINTKGDTHTVRIAVHDLCSKAELQAALQEACNESGAPELVNVDLLIADFYALDSNDVRTTITASTSADVLRGAKAFRVFA